MTIAKKFISLFSAAALLAIPMISTSSSSAEAAYCRPGWHATRGGLCKRTVFYRPGHHHRHYRRHIVRYYEPDYEPTPVYQPPIVVPFFGYGWGGGWGGHHHWRR